MTEYDVVVKSLPAQRVVIGRERVSSIGDIGHAEVRIFRRISDVVGERGRTSDPTFAMCQFTDDDPPILVSAAAPVRDAVEPEARRY